MRLFNEITELVSSEIAKIKWDKKPIGLYEPIGYSMEAGGKRIRPALALMACNLFTDELEPVIAPALGIEIFHNFTLLHDDIMDKADLRRGRATVHKKWDENTAILSGDAMQIVAYQLIAETPPAHLKAVLDLFSSTAIEVCEGQQHDVDFETRSTVGADEYLEMIRLKTAVLLACSLKIGALIGGATPNDADEIYDFGINLGLAFQLKDDLLDVYGDEATFGKKIGGDILCNKKTYLLIHALQLAKDENYTKLVTFLEKEYSEPQDKINDVTEMYNVLGVKKICEDKMVSYFEMAIANLNNIQVNSYKKQELRKLAEKLLSRND